MLFHRLGGLARMIDEALDGRAPTAEVRHTPNLTQFVRVPLEAGGGVSLALADRYPGAWLVMWPDGLEVARSAWPLDIDEEQLVDIVTLVVLVAARGGELPSPYRWGRVQRTQIVMLADELVVHGVDVGAVGISPLRTVDDNLRVRTCSDDGGSLHLLDRGETDRTLIANFDEVSGWAVDQMMPPPGACGRLDVPSVLGLCTLSGRVGRGETTPQELAQVLAGDTLWSDAAEEDDPRCLALYAEAPPVCTVDSRETAMSAATSWLVWAGFVEQQRVPSGPPRLSDAVEIHVDWSEKLVPIGKVQRVKGMASLSGRTPVLVARTGFTKNAVPWAEAAEMLLFVIDPCGLLHPANGRARPHACGDGTAP